MDPRGRDFRGKIAPMPGKGGAKKVGSQLGFPKPKNPISTTLTLLKILTPNAAHILAHNQAGSKPPWGHSACWARHCRARAPPGIMPKNAKILLFGYPKLSGGCSGVDGVFRGWGTPLTWSRGLVPLFWHPPVPGIEAIWPRNPPPQFIPEDYQNFVIRGGATSGWGSNRVLGGVPGHFLMGKILGRNGKIPSEGFREGFCFTIPLTLNFFSVVVEGVGLGLGSDSEIAP